ncbi:uncharacterized protein METZ01_LOCUS345922 [marine metagenome]|uniref:Uncharacterized protein n=1 Tax=marine metagenome TaxID=408172 RepID=A0A382R7T3_9ZZZZ
MPDLIHDFSGGVLLIEVRSSTSAVSNSGFSVFLKISG